jgi:thioredoxin reductase
VLAGCGTDVLVQVIVIGTGIAGINAGILFPKKVPNLDLVIYEKNPEVVSFCIPHHAEGNQTNWRYRAVLVSIYNDNANGI